MSKCQYKIISGCTGKKPYFMVYKRYIPAKPSKTSVVIMIGGGGHRMKILEETPNKHPSWASLFAKSGREVITLEWACNSSKVYHCSTKELCQLTQKENIDLINQVINKEISLNRKVVFLAWSMGGPHVFKLATDIIPKRTVAVMGYGATGPLNFFNPVSYPNISFEKPFNISQEAVNRICDSPFFPKKYKKSYAKKYLVPISPKMILIQSKHPNFKKYWNYLTIKKTKNLPPVILVNGTRDAGHKPAKEKVFVDWLKKHQKDVTLKYVKDFPHSGMVCRGSERVVRIYLDWLKRRGL